MAELNEQNFLRWTGSFNEAPYVVNANNDSVTVTTVPDTVQIALLQNDTATYGLDATSVIITSSSNTVTPPVWNSVTQYLTYTIDKTIMGANNQTVKYKFKDLQGHLSNEGTATIHITERPTAWRVDPASMTCVLSGGTNTGMYAAATLVKYWTDDNTEYVPRATKSNVSTDPDYIAPSENFAECPLTSMTQNFIIDNLFRNTVTITKVRFRKNGVGIGPPTIYEYNVNVLPFTSRTIKVTSDTFDTVYIEGTSITPPGQCTLNAITVTRETPYLNGNATFPHYDTSSNTNLRIAVGYDIY